MGHTKDVGLCVERCDGDFVVFQCHCRRCEERQLHRGAMRLMGSGSPQGGWAAACYSVPQKVMQHCVPTDKKRVSHTTHPNLLSSISQQLCLQIIPLIWRRDQSIVVFPINIRTSRFSISALIKANKLITLIRHKPTLFNIIIYSLFLRKKKRSSAMSNKFSLNLLHFRNVLTTINLLRHKGLPDFKVFDASSRFHPSF